MCSCCSCRVVSEEACRARIWTSPPAARHHFLPISTPYITSAPIYHCVRKEKAARKRKDWQKKILEKGDAGGKEAVLYEQCQFQVVL